MTQNKKTNQIYFSHVTWGHEVAIVTLTSTFKKTFKKTALAQQIHNDFKNLLNEMRFFNVVLVKLYNFFSPILHDFSLSENLVLHIPNHPSPCPRMHRGQLFFFFLSNGCAFQWLFYCQRQTIKVCRTHAGCPSAVCGTIKRGGCEKRAAMSSRADKPQEAHPKPAAIRLLF